MQVATCDQILIRLCTSVNVLVGIEKTPGPPVQVACVQVKHLHWLLEGITPPVQGVDQGSKSFWAQVSMAWPMAT